MDQGRVEELGRAIANVVSSRFAEDRNSEPTRLRMSNLGKGDRQLWYDINGSDEDFLEPLSPSTRRKFLYGDILELLLIFFAEEAGHDVQDKQRQVEVDGVAGSLDATIDRVVVDCKSCSTYSFKKFKEGTLSEDDPFGYMEQLGGYSTGLGGVDGAFLAIDKTLGNIALLEVPKEELKALDTPARVKHLKEVMKSDVEPDRCYEDEPEGKSGNMKLGVNCSYCNHKFHCWRDSNLGVGLRTFLYSKGPVYLTKVVREPSTFEVSF